MGQVIQIRRDHPTTMPSLRLIKNVINALLLRQSMQRHPHQSDRWQVVGLCIRHSQYLKMDTTAIFFRHSRAGGSDGIHFQAPAGFHAVACFWLIS